MQNQRNLTRELTFSAVLVAFAYVLSMVRVFHLPQGGSVTLFSMLPIAIVAFLFGGRWGLIAGVSLGIVNLVTNGYVIHPAQLVLDYVLAFGALGAGGFFNNTKGGLTLVYVIGVVGRCFFSTLSGVVFFASYAEGSGMNPLLYSLVYNGSYMGAEMVLTIVVINLPPFKNALIRAKESYGNAPAKA